MAFKMAGIQHQALAATGTQDYFPILSGTGGFVFSGDVKWGLFIASLASANSTFTSKPRFMMGLVDSTADQALLRIAGTDAVGTSAWSTRLDNNACVGSIDETGAVKTVATASIQDNGIRLTFTTADATAYRICGIVAGGSGVEANLVNTSFVGGAAETKTVSHGLSGTPTRYIVIQSSGAFGAGVGQGRGSIGFGVVGGSQASLHITRLGSQTTEQCAAYASTAFAGGQLSSGGTLDYTVTVQNFTATQADLVTNANAGTDSISILFIRNPNDGGKVGTFGWPANTTEFTAATGATKQPSAVIVLNSMLTALDTGSLTDNADFFGLGAAWLNNGAVEQLSAGINADDAATGTLNGKSITAGVLTQMPNPAGSTSQLVGGVTSFTSDGFKAQASTADATVRKSLYMLFGDTSPLPVITAIDPITMGSSFTITGTSFSGSGDTVTIGGVAQTVTGDTTTLLTVTPVQGSTLRYGTDYDLVVTSSGQSSVPITVQLNIEASLDYVNLVDPLVPASARVEGLPDLAGGFQLVWDDLTAVVTESGLVNTTNATTRTMKVRVHDGSTWSATASNKSDWTAINLVIVLALTNPLARGILRLLRKAFLILRHSQQFPR